MSAMWRAVLFLLCLPVALSGCVPGSSGGDGSAGAPVDGPNVLRVVAGSEIKDLVPLLERAKDAIGVSVALEYTGTLAGAESIAAGEADGQYDAAWYSSNRYLTLIGEASAKVATAEKTMVSPVVLGVKESKAKELGWDKAAPSWADIKKASADGSFTYGMTNPAASNSGFSALVAVATALAGGGAALDAERVSATTADLTEFFKGQTLTSGSSGWLAEQYVEKKVGGPDGIVNYESVLLSLKNGGQLSEPMTIIYPSDGVITADYPLTLLKSASDEKRALYTKLVDWLRTPEVQTSIMAETARRPITPTVKPDDRFSSQVLVELPFPGQKAVVDELIGAYLNKVRKPSQAIFVLDTSGSMRGDRLKQLKDTMAGLAGADTSTQGGFAKFRNREQIVVIGFSDDVRKIGEYDVPESGGKSVLDKLTNDVEGIEADGDTAMYSALKDAYAEAARLRQADRDRFTSVVLLTDGKWTSGITLEEFEAAYRSMPELVRTVPTFTVLFGASVPEDLESIASLTGGRVFDARGEGLSSAFQEIRGYQ